MEEEEGADEQPGEHLYSPPWSLLPQGSMTYHWNDAKIKCRGEFYIDLSLMASGEAVGLRKLPLKVTEFWATLFCFPLRILAGKGATTGSCWTAHSPSGANPKHVVFSLAKYVSIEEYAVAAPLIGIYKADDMQESV
ncbi:uncharacterized protein BDCG_01336 [Blastomyces dermatitidis ER-3]|uniref:Uncharacterized protein n=3 Tax=Blastomyces TaxID=229219 RepID=A0A179UEP5_BLAGS|nr:uncharacterized protein BDBG_02682 [Blastomyces gilchristii SLH14081]XP_045272477.1 uncharacterized protein BDCG_01336 [Blastomyces dermatitidis ER-3]EEQ84531.1 hypothetical protein BDCG_01336 [Blastomyces dermatitidis ER-3]EGE81393.1 hypothetical protein BDDG_04335 [Blastomyces dermatitidis ATCC 18188]OAT06495.1 hypothetical protein BDBG_02682 [Blastomyces gilchristii SLH14081]